MAITATTELDAINTMLSTIGESPINSLDGAAGVVDAVVAQQVLREISIQVQEEGWHFNTEENVLLIPDLVNQNITLPANCIQCDSTGKDADRDVTVRGNRLYDKKNKTFTFDNSIEVDMIILLEFNDMPQAARHYVMIRAARVFQERVIGSQTLGSFTEKDETRARAALERMESGTANHNMMSGSTYMQRILRRG